MINTVAKFIRKVFIPRSEFLDDEVERSIDNEKVDCKELEPPYLGVPAPVMMPIDEWFTDSNIEPVKTEKQITHEEMLEEAARREEENDQSKEPKDIHQKMYEMATRSGSTTLQLNPIGGSENFQGGSENFHER